MNKKNNMNFCNVNRKIAKEFSEKAVNTCVSNNKWSNNMAISGVGGIGQPNEPQKSQNINNQVEQYKASIFSECDTDNSGKIDAKNANGENEVKTFNSLVQSFIAKITGGNKTEQTQTQTGSAEDVQAATNAQSPDKSEPKFDKDGNLISDVKQNEDGSKDIRNGDETVHVSKNGDSISVKSDSGREVALVKTPDGGFEFKDEDGKVHKFDKDMNPQT